jgi:hypothetical protein
MEDMDDTDDLIAQDQARVQEAAFADPEDEAMQAAAFADPAEPRTRPSRTRTERRE